MGNGIADFDILMIKKSAFSLCLGDRGSGFQGARLKKAVTNRIHKIKGEFLVIVYFYFTISRFLKETPLKLDRKLYYQPYLIYFEEFFTFKIFSSDIIGTAFRLFPRVAYWVNILTR